MLEAVANISRESPRVTNTGRLGGNQDGGRALRETRSSLSALALQGGSQRRFDRGGEDWVRFARPRRRFSPPLLCRLPKPNAGSAAVLVDERDPARWPYRDSPIEAVSPSNRIGFVLRDRSDGSLALCALRRAADSDIGGARAGRAGRLSIAQHNPAPSRRSGRRSARGRAWLPPHLA